MLLLQERKNRLDWPIGRVESTVKSRDGKIRSCWIRLPIKCEQVSGDKGLKATTTQKYIKRGIEQLALLEEDLRQREVSQNLDKLKENVSPSSSSLYSEIKLPYDDLLGSSIDI